MVKDSRGLEGDAPKRSRSGRVITNEARRSRIGRVQRQIRRALIGLGRPLTMRELLPWAFPTARKFKHWMRWSINRAARRVARPVGKTRARHATTWVLRDMRATRSK